LLSKPSVMTGASGVSTQEGINYVN
jgi:hypothetical protein